MRIFLQKDFFHEKERRLLEQGNLKVISFRYSTGVEALKVENERGYFIILPFQGQQIWRACFDGQELTMKTHFAEPVPTEDYLKTYGGFLLHCGITAFGVPQKGDTHVLHGELPNARYQLAYLDCGDDYVSVGGVFDYNLSFTRHYTFCPECRLYEGDTILKIQVELENKRQEPMEYMYLCHINFRPFDGAQLIYSADYDPQNIKVHKVIGNGVSEEKRQKLLKYMEELEEEPEKHHIVGGENQIYDPEICFAIRYRGDEEGRAYTLQYGKEGACYVSHPSEALPVGVRWIARTGDEDAMGMVLPATAEHLGYQNAKQNGQIRSLHAKGKVNFKIEAGYLEKQRAEKVKNKIKRIKETRYRSII